MTATHSLVDGKRDGSAQAQAKASTKLASRRMGAEFAFVVSSGLAAFSFGALTLWQMLIG